MTGSCRSHDPVPQTLTVVVCTHNPRRHYITRVLEGLRAQTLPVSAWELLLIDNCNQPPLDSYLDVSWHPAGRIIREPELGLTPARLCGIREARGELLVFVDDDNVLDRTYLEEALQIASSKPFLGAWGGGIDPEFEIPCPPWARPYVHHLSLRQVETEQWSNMPYQSETAPWGAGMCVRLTVARRYAEVCRTCKYRSKLDRRGESLLSAGDSDLAFTSCDMGLGIGLFPQLRLTHLIPKERMGEDYLVRIAESVEFSALFLRFLRGEPCRAVALTTRRKIVERLRFLALGRLERRFHRASNRARERAMGLYAEICEGKLVEIHSSSDHCALESLVG